MFHLYLLPLVTQVEVQTTHDVVVTETHHHLEVTVVHQVDTVLTADKVERVVSEVMARVVTSMYMVVEVMVGLVTTLMVPTPQEQVTSVADSLHHITKETTLIDINLMLRGELVVMALDKIIEVLEDVKALSLYMNSTDKY